MGAEAQFDGESLALDDEAVRHLGNAKVVLSDVPEENLTARESSRLQTVQRKLGELEEIVRNRKAGEF